MLLTFVCLPPFCNLHYLEYKLEMESETRGKAEGIGKTAINFLKMYSVKNC